MKKTILIITILAFVSCEKQSPQQQLQYLTGYWEIKEVTLVDGSVRNYTINTLIDYITIKGDSGVRAKVAPKLDGGFTATKTQEQFRIKIVNDSLHLYYETPYASWKETILKTKDSILTVLNEDGKVYTYKRFKTFNLSQ